MYTRSGCLRALREEPLLVARLAERSGRLQLIQVILLIQLAVTPQRSREARELVHASMADYDTGHFEKALAEAEQAYRLDPLPEILFNIGQANRALGRWRTALFCFQRYLAKLATARNRPVVEALVAEAQRHLKDGEARLGAAQPAPRPLVVVASPPPAPWRRESAPPAAVTAPAAPPPTASHGHAAAWLLGSAALVSLAVMAIGIVQLESFERQVASLGQPAGFTSLASWNAAQSSATRRLPAAQAWEAAAFATGALALGTGTAAVLTW